jgi:hypothetical protein
VPVTSGECVADGENAAIVGAGSLAVVGEETWRRWDGRGGEDMPSSQGVSIDQSDAVQEVVTRAGSCLPNAAI